MAKKKTYLYPGMDAARKESERVAKEKRLQRLEQPDIIETASGFCPNYEKFSGWTTEKALVWCNID